LLFWGAFCKKWNSHFGVYFSKCPYFKFFVILFCCHRKKIEKNQSRSLTPIKAPNHTHHQDQAYALLHIIHAKALSIKLYPSLSYDGRYHYIHQMAFADYNDIF
jgi:hypothetical protein